MYYEVHGSGEPVVLLHGAFMTITNNWTGWIGELSKTRKVIAVEMQGHGRTADIERDISCENLADDVAALLDHLKIPKADRVSPDLRDAQAATLSLSDSAPGIMGMRRLLLVNAGGDLEVQRGVFLK